MLSLPESLRTELKDPAGPVFTDAERLLAHEDAGRPVIAVGDVVTEHLLAAADADVPAVALVDGQTERTPLDERVDLSPFDRHVTVENPAAELSEELIRALSTAIARASAEAPDGDGATTAIEVEGEEDLAALPAVVAAPDGACVVYGQPGEGMVLLRVTDESRARMRGLLEAMDGDVAGAFEVLGA